MEKINFECKKCGKCCAVGFIYLKKGEAEKMAAFTGLPVRQFKKKYTEFFLFLGRALKWGEDGACLFLKQGKCSVYPARPSQCSSWPYWKNILGNMADRERAKAYCKGIS